MAKPETKKYQEQTGHDENNPQQGNRGEGQKSSQPQRGDQDKRRDNR
jgi:hypothetical protein